MQGFSGDSREENKTKFLECDLMARSLCLSEREESGEESHLQSLRQADQSNKGLKHRQAGCSHAETDQHHLMKKNILPHNICVWSERPTQLSINPCNKLLPHISWIRIVVSIHNWSQSQVIRVLIWRVVIPNVSFQLKAKSCAGSQWRVWNREVNCLRSYRWFVVELKSCALS